MLRGEAGKGCWTLLLESATHDVGCLGIRRQGRRPERLIPPSSPPPHLPIGRTSRSSRTLILGEAESGRRCSPLLGGGRQECSSSCECL